MSSQKIFYNQIIKISSGRKFLIGKGKKITISKTNSSAGEADEFIKTLENTSAVSISEPIKKAISSFVKDAQNNGYWENLGAFYLPIWGDATANQYNLVNPALLPLSFSGSVSHEDGFIRSNGGYVIGPNLTSADLGINGSNNMFGFNSVYGDAEDSVDMGLYYSSTVRHYIRAQTSSSLFQASNSSEPNRISTSNNSSMGLFVLNKTSPSRMDAYKDSSLLATTSITGSDLTNANMYFMAANAGGVAYEKSSRKYNAFFIGAGISNINSFNNDVAKLLESIHLAESINSNYSLSFDGIDDEITVENSELDLGTKIGNGDFSVFARIKIPQSPNSINTFFYIGTKSANANYFTLSYDTSTSKFKLQTRTGSSASNTVYSEEVSTGEWYNVCFTRTGSTAKLYVNGALNTTSNDSNNACTFQTPDSYITIGSFRSVLYSPSSMRDFALFDTVLNSNSIAEISRFPFDLRRNGDYYSNKDNLLLYIPMQELN